MADTGDRDRPTVSANRRRTCSAADLAGVLRVVARLDLALLGLAILRGEPVWSAPGSLSLPAEIGWRGYLLDRLQERWAALAASLVVGVVWFTGHIPLFFLPGYYERAGGAPDPVRMAIAIVLISILITWVYNHTGRNVLAAILLHFSDNFSGELLDTSAATETYTTVLAAVVVLLVIVRWGRPDLGARERAGGGPRRTS